MERYASKVVAVMLAEVGYLEKKSNSQLDSKTANAGYNNYTKYARDLDAIGFFYNGPKNGYPYCDVFYDWCHVQAFGVDAALELLCQPSKSYGAGCDYSAGYYKKKGQFHKTGPKIGDQIFFWNSKKTAPGHTGGVTKVDSTYVYTCEGNTSGASGVIANGGGVCEKKYKLNDPCIYGYGRPNYDPEPGEAEAPKNEESQEEVCTVEIKVLRKGDKGNTVKALQILLAGNGCSCGASGADGDFGPATLSALKKYQEKKNLVVDGICGPATWAALLGTK